MHLTVKGKQLDVGDALRSHVAENLKAAVGKHFDNPIDATVVFSREAHLFRADISVHVGRNILVQSNGAAAEPYPAFDTACDKITERLRRYKGRLKNHHPTPEAASQLAAQYVLEREPENTAAGDEDAAEGDGTPVIIAELTTPIDTLTVSEAVMRLELAELAALLFRNRAHGELNLVYRRADGHIGWVDPKPAA